MKRNPRKLAWTKAYRSAHGKEMVIDSTLKFATRRNVPVRYNRDLVAKTLQAMDKVAEIRKKRERVFYMNRMKGNKERQRVEDRKLVEENQHLLPPEERTVVPEVTIKKNELKKKMEELREKQITEEMEVDEMEQEEVVLKQSKTKTKKKQRLVRGVGAERMDVDD